MVNNLLAQAVARSRRNNCASAFACPIKDHVRRAIMRVADGNRDIAHLLMVAYRELRDDDFALVLAHASRDPLLTQQATAWRARQADRHGPHSEAAFIRHLARLLRPDGPAEGIESTTPERS